MRWWLVILPMALLAGCQGQEKPASTSLFGQKKPTLVPITPETLKTPGALAQTPVFIRLEVHEVLVPLGRISSNEEFWKRINEQCVDVGVYDVLFKNGIRVGVAPISEWGYLSGIIEQYSLTSTQTSFQGAAGRPAELQMSGEVERQDLFYYDSSNNLVGRTYDHCRDLLAVTYQPAPRKPGYVRIKLCPVVRSVREQLEYTPLHEEQPVRFVHPERIYDLSLEADVPIDSFLVVAPSREGKWPTSIGSTFMVKDGDTERLERLLIMVPQAYRYSDEHQAQIAKGRAQESRSE